MCEEVLYGIIISDIEVRAWMKGGHDLSELMKSDEMGVHASFYGVQLSVEASSTVHVLPATEPEQ